MSDGLFGGRHHRVISRNNDDGNIGNLSTTGTHGRKSLMAWCIEECNLTTILQFHVVGTDVLGDTTSLTSNHVCVTDMVEQRSLTMINMSHHRYNRGASHEIVLIVFLLSNSVLNLCTDVFGSKTELLSYNIDSLSIEALID